MKIKKTNMCRINAKSKNKKIKNQKKNINIQQQKDKHSTAKTQKK